MFISFSGVIIPYTYCCPHAHFLRNIKRVVIPKREPDEEDPKVVSRRERGIKLHADTQKYLAGEEEEIEFSTDEIEYIRQYREEFPNNVFLEREFKLPYDDDVLYARPDALVYTPEGHLRIYDWKFANPDYGATRYYDETEFFLSVVTLTGELGNVYEAETCIHFPENDYSLPEKKFPAIRLAATQRLMMDRIDVIRKDRIYQPNPAPNRCRFCNYRSQDTGGSGNCNYTLI
jgi:hypothetical protein